jgi:hypothetical protein
MVVGGEWEGLSESKSVVGAMEGELFAEESNKRVIWFHPAGQT